VSVFTRIPEQVNMLTVKSSVIGGLSHLALALPDGADDDDVVQCADPIKDISAFPAILIALGPF
jgi:hypothetical protein